MDGYGVSNSERGSKTSPYLVPANLTAARVLVTFSAIISQTTALGARKVRQILALRQIEAVLPPKPESRWARREAPRRRRASRSGREARVGDGATAQRHDSPSRPTPETIAPSSDSTVTQSCLFALAEMNKLSACPNQHTADGCTRNRQARLSETSATRETFPRASSLVTPRRKQPAHKPPARPGLFR